MVARCAVRWPAGFVGVSSFGCFLGGFGWFLLVEDNFGWLQVVCCFSSYTDFTVYRRVNSLLHSWSHVIDWGHWVFFIQSKIARKRLMFCLVTQLSQNTWLLPILYCISFQKFLWINSHKTQSKWEYCEIFETRSFGGERLNILKVTDTLWRDTDYLFSKHSFGR